jgi:hypothetical protein
MADRNKDYRPSTGQKSNENWDDQNDQRQQQEQPRQNTSAERMDEETNTSGYGSSQRSEEDNVAPLDSDLDELPSDKRRERNSNQTGPGLG